MQELALLLVLLLVDLVVGPLAKLLDQELALVQGPGPLEDLVAQLQLLLWLLLSLCLLLSVAERLSVPHALSAATHQVEPLSNC